jgi:site-specific DNA-cytosine methylase
VHASKGEVQHTYELHRGCCEVDPEVSAELETSFPHVPNHGDMRTVIAAMESGELALQPDILIFAVPCQSRSRARLLTEWYNKEHPRHHLWALQAKFIALAKPKMVLIENVRPRSRGDKPTQSMYGWMPHNASFDFLDLTLSILLLRQFSD